MHRTTIMVSPDLKRKARDLARSQAISFGEFTRRALETAVKTGLRDGRRQDPFLSDHTVFTGHTPKDLSVHHDFYLYGE